MHMNISSRLMKLFLGLTLVGSIGVAGSQSIMAQDVTEDENETEIVETMDVLGHSHMEHDDEGRLPGGIKIMREPTYKVGDDVILNHGHMAGMEGAQAVIVAAFETTAYEISYTATDGSGPVLNHRWIVHEEVENYQETPYMVGDQIVVDAYHIAGMEGADATIDDVTTQTVYMIDYVDTQTGELIINHKWVVEEELMPVEDGAEVDPVEEESEMTSSEESESGTESESEVEETSESEESSESEETSESDDTTVEDNSEETNE